MLQCNLLNPKQPPRGFRTKIVDGSHLRTESHVDLGAARGARFYDTSMKSDFTTVSVPYNKAPGMTTDSSIPLDYYRKYKNIEKATNSIKLQIKGRIKFVIIHFFKHIIIPVCLFSSKIQRC